MSECYNCIGKTKNLYEYLGLGIILLKILFISKCTVVIIHCNLMFLVKVFYSVILLITFLFNFTYMVLVHLLLNLHCLFNGFKMFLTLFTDIPNSVIGIDHWKKLPFLMDINISFSYFQIRKFQILYRLI